MPTLSEALKTDPNNRGAFEAIRSLLEKVILHPTEDGFHIDIEGDLAQILALTSNTDIKSAAGMYSKTTKPSELSFEGSVNLSEQVKMVLGVGLVSSGLCPFLVIPLRLRLAPYEPFTVQTTYAAHIRKKGPVWDPFYRIGCGSRI